MSAFIVSDKHIHALINYAVRMNVCYRVNGNRVAINAHNAEEIGQILVDENYRSVNHRYHERTEGHFGKPGTYKFKRSQVMADPVVILKLANCYGYQACECDNWESSIAFDVIANITQEAIRKLPGYDAAPWGI